MNLSRRQLTKKGDLYLVRKDKEKYRSLKKLTLDLHIYYTSSLRTYKTKIFDEIRDFSYPKEQNHPSIERIWVWYLRQSTLHTVDYRRVKKVETTKKSGPPNGTRKHYITSESLNPSIKSLKPQVGKTPRQRRPQGGDSKVNETVEGCKMGSWISTILKRKRWDPKHARHTSFHFV